jgi:hypothetical protein
MKKMWIAALGLSLVAAVALRAQDHGKEKKAIDEVTISTPIMIGGQVLAPGKYEVSCDTNEVTFTRLSDHEKVLTLACKGKDLGKKSEFTEVHSDLNPAGVRVVTKLLIRGSNVEHIF